MAEKIYIRDAGGALEPLTEQPFDSEALLQELIGQHPELLAGEQMRPDDPLRWILIRREMPIEGWAIDHLLLDQDARPTLVEVKRGESRRIRRTVVGQMLDYAATAANVWSGDGMRQAFEEDAKKRRADPIEELNSLLQPDGETDVEDLADEFWERAATNLIANRLRLLFVADEIPAELERVVKFLNEQTRENLEVLAVEVKQYPGQFGNALVSRVIGQVDPAGKSAVSNSSRRLSRNELMDLFHPNVRDAMDSLANAVQRVGGELRFRRTAITVRGRCSIWQHPVYLARFWVHNGGSFVFSIDRLDDSPQELRTFLESWVGQFRDDDFTVADHYMGLEGWSVNSDDFVKHIDLLTNRLCTALFRVSQIVSGYNNNGLHHRHCPRHRPPAWRAVRRHPPGVQPRAAHRRPQRCGGDDDR